MLEVGLTGSRCSGKDGVAKLFSQLGVPVFDADAIVKYLLNFKPGVTMSVEKAFGKEYVMDDYINPFAFNTDEKFSALIDLIEFEIFETYKKFKLKQKDKTYIIFHSSLIFERNYQKKFDSIISVFAPKSDRMERYHMQTGESPTNIQNLFSREISDFSKNQMSDFIIHNYLDAPDILQQVQNIDDKIIESKINNYILTSYDKRDKEELDIQSHKKNIFT